MDSKGSREVTVKELIEHLQTFDEKALVVVPTCDNYGDPDGIAKVEKWDVESRGKYVILFDNMPFLEVEIEEILDK